MRQLQGRSQLGFTDVSVFPQGARFVGDRGKRRDQLRRSHPICRPSMQSGGGCRVGVNSQKSVKVARADNPEGVCRIGVNSLKRADRE